ncbi:hypothetical protein QOT17_003378 [Balamuthia mandrillaris]
MLCAVTSHKSWGLPGALYGCTSFVTYCCDCSLDPQKTVPKDELLIFLAGDFGRPSIFCLADPQSSFVNNWECLVTTEEDPFIGLRLKRRSRRTPWTPLLLVFGQGEQRVLVVPYENSRDLDNQLCLLFYLYLTGGDQQQPGGSSRPSLEKAKALFASPELAALLEVDSLAACRLAQTKRKPRKRQRDESAAYFWRRCFEQQNQQFEALLSKNLTGQKSFLELWRRYWEIQQLSRAPLEALKQSSVILLWHKPQEKEALREYFADHPSLPWVLVPGKRRRGREDFSSILRIFADGRPMQTFKYDKKFSDFYLRNKGQPPVSLNLELSSIAEGEVSGVCQQTLSSSSTSISTHQNPLPGQ